MQEQASSETRSAVGAKPAFELLELAPPGGSGIACGGNWVVDRNKVIERYPEENSLAMILDESVGGGGCAYNVIIDLAKLDPELKLTAVGLIGDDENGAYVLDECRGYPNIDLRHLIRTNAGRTAYTDAYTVLGGRSRTFFSALGVNRLFDWDCFELESLKVWLFHLGYLNLLERLDQPDPDYGRVSARFLARLKAKGIQTSIDLVSIVRDDFGDVIRPALGFTDILFANDFETEELTGIRLRRTDLPSAARLRDAARMLFEAGPIRLVIVHFPEGVFLATSDGVELLQPALDFPASEVRGTAGAGDAFCAGFLYGLHQGYPLERTARFAVSAGAMSLFDLSTTGAVRSWQEVNALQERYSFRSLQSSFAD